MSTAALVSSPSGSTRNDFSGYLGFSFTPTSDISVTHLGRWKVAGGSGTHTILLYRPAAGQTPGGPVDGGSVALDLAGQPDDAWAYAPLAAPVTLSAGVSYVVASEEASGGDLWWNTAPVTAASGIALGKSAYANGPESFNEITAGEAYVPPNFLFEAPTPPPTVAGASIDAAGTTLTVTFSEAVTGGSGFAISGGRALGTASGTGASRSFSVAPGVYAGQSPTLSYSPGDVANLSGVALAAASNLAIANGSTVPQPPYDHTADPTAFLVLDDRSTFNTSGGVVSSVSNASASGKAYQAVPFSGAGVAVGADGSGHQYLAFDGTSTLQVASSAEFDAEFANSGDEGGWGVLAVVEPTGGGSLEAWICYKGALGTNTDRVNLVQIAGTFQAYNTVAGFRPLPAAYSGAIVSEFGTTYRDGTTVFLDGVPETKSGGSGAGTAGQPLMIGCANSTTGYVWDGKLRALVCWNRAPRYHEVLATDRYYRARYGLPETLTNQPFALVAESNSEACVMDASEPGLFDRAAVAAGTGRSAVFNLARGSRSGSQIVADYDGWANPLINALRNLGMPVAVSLFELINDGYGTQGAASYANYWAKVKDSGARFSVGTVMARSGTSPSFGDPSLNNICLANNTVKADASADGYPVAGIGDDPSLGVYDAANYSDGLHLNSTGIALAYPYLRDAVSASLASGVQSIAPPGVAPTSAVGTPAVAPGPVALAPPGIAPAGSVGVPSVVATAPGAQAIAPAGIGPGVGLGTPAVAPGPASIVAPGVAPASAVGTPVVAPGAVAIAPSGIAPAGSVGTPVVVATAPGAKAIAPSGIASRAVVGSPRVARAGDAAAGPVLVERELIAWLDARLAPLPTWSGARPQRAALPALVLQLVDGDQVGLRLEGRSRLATVRIQLDAYAGSPAGCESALEAVADQLDGYRGPMGAATVKNAHRHPRRGGFIPAGSGSGSGIHRRMNEYTLTYF